MKKIFFENIKKIIENTKNQIEINYLIGQKIVLEYSIKKDVEGEDLKKLSLKLKKDYGDGFSNGSLKKMKNFYLRYSNRVGEKKKFDESDFKLSWSHYVALTKIKSADERLFYEIEAIRNNWSLRDLREQIDSALYKRLVQSKNKGESLSKKGEQLEKYLLDMGKGFLFQGRQVRFTQDEKHNFIDIVFYNRILKCFVLIDLIKEKFINYDMKQMQKYLEHYDRHIKEKSEKKTIGIIICKDKKRIDIEMILPEKNKRKYIEVLPSIEEIKNIVK